VRWVLSFRLVELGEPGLVPLFVKLAVVMALDRKVREKGVAGGAQHLG
jgi:hypothetical protein